MAGGLIQLVTYGTQDIFLTGIPQITYFKMVYRRHTNFSIESVEQRFDGIVDFDRQVCATLDKNGDLINRVYLEVTLPEVHLKKKDLNPDYASPTDTLKNCFTQSFRPDDIDFALKTKDKNNAEAAFLTFKVFIGHLMDVYRYSIQQIKQCVDLNVSKDINNKYPEESLAFNLLDTCSIFFDDISVDITTIKILLCRYNEIFNLTNNRTNIDSLPYKFIINIISKFYSKENKYVNMPEILFSTIDLKSQIERFFETTSNIFLEDEQRENLLLCVFNQWYSNARIVYLFLQKQYKYACDALDEVCSPFVKFAWIKRIGHYIGESIEILIGGRRIDKHYSDWLNIWYELSRNFYQGNNYDKMIGDVKILTNFGNKQKPEYKLYIPLQFWFCRHNGLALPLIAMRYHDVQINIKFRKLEECAYIEDCYTLFDALHIENASLFVDYVYLDSIERKRFARASHEYLIEQVQREEFTNVLSTKYTACLNFVHPSKELIWTCQANRYRLNPNENNLILNPSNYSISYSGKGNPILEAEIQFNTHTRVQNLCGAYYNCVQPYQSHSNTPSDGINLYSFALFPELHQPSGSVNFSRISNIVVQLLLDEKIFENVCDIVLKDNTCELGIPLSLAQIIDEVLLTFYCTNYNVLRVMSGMAGLAFSP